MKKILFVLLALALVSAGLYAYRVTDVDFYGTKTGSSVGTTGTGGSGSGYDGDAYGPNVAASGGAGGAAGAGSGSGGGGDDDLGPGGNLGEGQTVKEALAECMKNDDGKARGICLSKLHKDGKPIDSTVSMNDIAKGCKGVGDQMESFNTCSNLKQTKANRAKQRNHIECCSWANLGVNTGNRQACCGEMWKPKYACVLYYKGQCKDGNGKKMQNVKYNINACQYVKDKDPWCGGETEECVPGEEPECEAGGTTSGGDNCGDTPTLACCQGLSTGKAIGQCGARLASSSDKSTVCNAVYNKYTTHSSCKNGKCPCANSGMIADNRAYKHAHIECCVALGYERSSCCELMKNPGNCSHYWRLPSGSCRNAKNTCKDWPAGQSVTNANCQG